VIHSRWIVVLVALARTATAQTPSVIVREPGPGLAGHFLANTLAKGDTRVLIADTLTLTKDSVYSASVVVIGHRVIASSVVKGDLIVVGGDLFIHPGAAISGQAIAIGGGVYPSLLSQIAVGGSSYRDFTFDTTRVNGALELTYRELNAPAPRPLVALPFSFASRIPTYDRSDGLSLSLGPSKSFLNESANATALATYRSQIGIIDPSFDVEWEVRRQLRLSAFVGRDTRSNERWITSDISNSLNALAIGRDTRNWYRADAADLTAYRTVETSSLTAIYRLGGRMERAFSVRPDTAPTSAPWSLIGRESDEGMFRPNPQVPRSTISSVVAGANFAWAAGDMKADLDVGAEVPVSIDRGNHFIQTTVDGRVTFPTFGSQSYRFDAHAVLTTGDTAPMQRWAYLGGAGTLGTIEPPLVLGGDELLFLESRYIVPIPAITLPYAGSPTVTFRHILGNADVQHLSALTQILGVRLSVTLLRTELLVDTKTHKTEFHTGLALVR
jgi:hypothetical protein